MFLCCYVAWPCDLDLRPFDLESISCIALLMSDPHTNFYYPMTIGYWVTSTKYLIPFPLPETVTAHAPCHVTSNRGQNSPHFWNPWSQFAYSLCHFQGDMTKIKPCYRQKNSVFPLWRLQSLLRIGGHPKPHVTIFWPRIAYSLYNFYGATMTIMGSLYCSILMLKRFSVAKKTVQSKSVPKMAVFRKFKGPNIKYSHRDPQKVLTYPERRHLTYIA